MRYVIIGNGAAGQAAVGAIRTRDQGGQVLILSSESHSAYYRPLISALVENGMNEVSLFREKLPALERVEVKLGVRVIAIDPKEKNLILENDEALPYDRLLLATGSSAIRLPITGLDGPNVHVLRTIKDAEAIKQSAEGAERAVVIGGGRVGMKSAFALRNRGLDVTVVEQLSRVVPLQLDDVAAEIMGQAVESHGIELFLGKTVQKIEKDKSGIRAVVLDDGNRLNADLIIVAIGVEPNVELAEAASLRVNQGVLVNEYLQTSDPDIFAAGDVVETVDIVTGESIVSGIWTNAVEMGRIAGENMAGGHVEYPGAFGVLNSFELAGIPTISIGLIDPPESDDYQVYADRRGDSYRKLVLKDGLLKGALLVNDIEGAGVYTGLIKRKVNVEQFLEALLAPRPSYAFWLRQEAADVGRGRAKVRIA
jgi:nitrite reductase (NADH) large subunit